MNQFKLACHTITFGENQKEDLDAVFGAIAAAGYEGLEIGIRHIQETPPAELRGILDKHSLHMVATHIGGNLADRAQADSESQLLDTILDYLQVTGSKFLMYSGLKDPAPDQVFSEIEMLNWAAKRSKKRGVQLLYHNHHWEFFDRDGSTIWEAFIKNASPELKLCPDLAWLHKAGVDLIEFLETYQNRIGVIHFKDFATLNPDLTDTVFLGEGCVPIDQAAAWIKNNMSDIWLISEQDFSDVAPEEAISVNGKFFRKTFGA